MFEPHGIVIPTVSSDCADPQTSAKAAELMMIADRIGNRMAMLTWLRGQVDSCVSDLETYYMDTLSNSMSLLPTAQSQVTAKLAELKEVIGNVMESDAAFRTRMEAMFDQQNMMTPIPDVLPNPEIVIPDLPDNSPPGVATKRQMLVEFRENLIKELTFAMWLMD